MITKLLIGTGADRIYAAVLDEATGVLSMLPDESIPTGKAPTWLERSAAGRVVYAVNELDDKIQRFELRDDGESQPNSRWVCTATTPSWGSTPCHLRFSPDMSLLACANYMSSFAVLDASTAQLCFVGDMGHEATGPQSDRQEATHPHQCVFDATGRFLIVCDLGTDTIAVCSVGAPGDVDSQGRRAIALVSKFKTAPGMGPRHLAFHPRVATVVYLVNELASSVSVLRWNVPVDESAPPSFTLIDTVSCLPHGKTSTDYGGRAPGNDDALAAVPSPEAATNTCACIAFSPDATRLFVSNRGRDSVVGFNLVAASGRIAGPAYGEFASLGRTPRYFAFTPSGSFALVLNQESDSVVVMRYDAESGALRAVATACVPSPQCVSFV